MRWYGIALALGAFAGIGAAQATTSNQLLHWSQSSLTVISDGTSNTITFGETTTFNVCFDHVRTPGGISDGTSNTILFGENTGFFVIPGAFGPRVPITSITDGTSNTIILGETVDLCLTNVVVDPTPPGEIPDGTSNTIIVGEDSRFDICFRNVGLTQITDGTSNTIVLGENACFTDLQVAELPEPAGLVVAVSALAMLPFARRRRET
jgi:hypothetical protein